MNHDALKILAKYGPVTLAFFMLLSYLINTFDGKLDTLLEFEGQNVKMLEAIHGTMEENNSILRIKYGLQLQEPTMSTPPREI